MHIFSKWIKYESALANFEMKYSVTVNDKNMYNAFTLRPKLCDDLSHCVDFYDTKIEENGLDRIHYANFYPLTNAKFVKVLFYLEYFNARDQPEQINIDIKLLHFGNPCERDPCKGRGICFMEPDAGPDDAKCDCDTGYYGDRCELIDYCNTLININGLRQSGNKYCKDNAYGECETSNYTFRCTCDDDHDGTFSKIWRAYVLTIRNKNRPKSF